MMTGIWKLLLGAVWLVVFLVVFLLVFMTFADNSSDDVSIYVSYLDYTTLELSVPLWMLCSFIGGLLVGYLFSLAPLLTARINRRRLQQQLQRRDIELDEMRQGAKEGSVT